MKKLLILFLLAAMPMLAQDFDPVGKWSSPDTDGQLIYMTFDKEGFVNMQKGDQIIGGKDFEMEGIKGQMTYKFDTAKHHVDLIFTELANKEERRMQGIYKVVNKDEIIIAISEFERPVDVEGSDAVTFKRVK